jgi:hypothetical protein
MTYLKLKLRFSSTNVGGAGVSPALLRPTCCGVSGKREPLPDIIFAVVSAAAESHSLIVKENSYSVRAASITIQWKRLVALCKYSALSEQVQA